MNGRTGLAVVIVTSTVFRIPPRALIVAFRRPVVGISKNTGAIITRLFVVLRLKGKSNNTVPLGSRPTSILVRSKY